MQAFTSIDLQKQTGDVQRAASREGAVITSHGKPRNVMLSVEEFCRLKRIAQEAVPPSLLTCGGVTVRHARDPLGYDIRNFRTAARQMAEDALAATNDDAVEAELAAVRKKFGRRLP
ncbi:type II toxin-antitoxin system Phd/YefM family antitoxin [Aurantimonas aggregata]|uniref:Type II toxin-antitoxin system Phd/YefM family antitoxin n=1 Tax=Aurantimonas aggregata TaxID=2047720 RepID=A0A6L9MFL7_9HYPH|nr:type II toxin-antitoxin system Phd/YefM family antitoxin [Aurantimonas aggregata]NDV86649.1 type II toxin-antitoxin system Phd/YefM family antitoxin [Aurantimonas aggregata]